MNRSRPRVSVVMPVHNAGAFLPAAIGSVLSQTWEDFELVVAHDRSTDGSGDLVRALAGTDPRIRVIETGGVGPARARNEAIEVACGDYIAMLDHDDVSRPDRLECQLAAAEAHPEVQLWGSAVDYIDWQDRVIGAAGLGPRTIEDWRRELDAGRPVMLTGSTLFARREVFRACGGYLPGLLCDDIELSDRVSATGPVLELPQKLVAYRVHAGAASTKHHDVASVHLRFVWHRAAQRSRGEPLDDLDQFMAWYRNEPLHRRVAWRVIDRSRLYLREAAIARAQDHTAAALGYLTLAIGTNPSYAVNRAWTRIIAPRLHGRAHMTHPAT